MVGPSELKRLWRKYREYRITKRRDSSGGSKESIALDEATSTIVGLGLDTKQDEEYVEYVLYEDPRFINNPHGIGCSKDYEEPYSSNTTSFSSSPASMRHRVPRKIEINESAELRSFPTLGAWKTESIDMVKGKRKGRMPGDSADDRYKFLLDGPASRGRFSAKRFTRVRERARTR